MKKILTGLFGLLLAVIPISAAFADAADGTARAYSGTVACGGNQVVRNGGKEFQGAVYVLRNYDPKIAIKIDRIRFFDSHGVVTHNFTGVLPTFVNGVLGAGDPILDPNQTAQLRSWDVLGMASLPLANRPIQVKIDWSAHGKPLLLEVGLVRLARERIVKPSGAVKLGAERSRHLYECRTIRKKTHKY